MDKGRPLPKFGEWDVNDPASAQGFTVIFNKARNEKKTAGGKTYEAINAVGREEINNSKQDGSKISSKKWLCCIAPAAS